LGQENLYYFCKGTFNRPCGYGQTTVFYIISHQKTRVYYKNRKGTYL